MTDTHACPYCEASIPRTAAKCRHCGEWIDKREMARARQAEVPKKGDYTAGCLGLFLGPVGLWYKGKWAAGFAWLAMTVLLGAASGGFLAPVLWLGMAIHAMVAETAS